MTGAKVLSYCLARPGVWQDEPRDDITCGPSREAVVVKLPRRERPA